MHMKDGQSEKFGRKSAIKNSNNSLIHEDDIKGTNCKSKRFIKN